MASEKIRATEIMSEEELDNVVGGVEFNRENFIINAKMIERNEFLKGRNGAPKIFAPISEPTKNLR